MADRLPKNVSLQVLNSFQQHPGPISTRDDIILIDPNAYDAVHFRKRKDPYGFVRDDGNPEKEYYCEELRSFLHPKTMQALINRGYLKRF